MRKALLGVAASVGIGCSSLATAASAADILPPAPAPVFHTWSGFYIGGHVGYGEADFDAGLFELDEFDDDDDEVVLFRRDLETNGILGGVHGGFNWQVGTFLFGVEGDISFTDWDDDDEDIFDDNGDDIFDDDERGESRAEVDFLASIRGRAGLAFDTLLLYGTGGVAFADGEVRVRDVSRDRSGTADFDDIGWVVGGGGEWAVIPNRFSVGVEGLWYFFDDDEDIFDDDDDFFDNNDFDTRRRAEGGFDDAWVVRARANFHFGGPGGGLFGGSGLF